MLHNLKKIVCFIYEIFTVLGNGKVGQINLGNTVSLSGVRDMAYCGRIFVINILDEENNIPEVLEHYHHRICKPVIVKCDNGK